MTRKWREGSRGLGAWGLPLPSRNFRRPVLEGVDACDVLMIQRGEDLGFALEAGQALGIGGHGFGQHLDRDLSAQLHVFGEVDLTHAAFAELVGDSKVGEGSADHDKGLGA